MISKLQSKARLRINRMKDVEELQIRTIIANDEMFKLELLTAFMPGLTLRQINNLRRANISNHK